MSHLLTIAIDGPAASGKSTVGKLVAQRLNFLYFDTGAMYRALTVVALENGVDPNDEASLGDLATQTVIFIEPPDETVQDERQYTVRVDHRDITWEIRHPLVDRNVSRVSRHRPVRAALRAQQRRVGESGNVVMVGRDIGTVVMPDAPLKIYLDASPEERARRRLLEGQARGEQIDYDALLAEIRARDEQDRNRTEGPLRQADDAMLLDTDRLSIDEVVQAIVQMAEAKGWTRSEVSAPTMK